MWYIILSLITVIYIVINLVIPSTFSGIIGTYVIRPILWISLAILTILIAQHEGLNIWQFKKIRKWEIGKTPFHAALLIGGFQVSLLVIAGLFAGFGKSPYSSTPVGIATNLLFMASALFGIELSRAYLIKKGTSTRRNITLILASVTILFMLVNVAPMAFTVLDFSDPAASVKFIGETIIPLLAMSLFASYLAYLGGALTAIGYMGILQAFEWFSPILPDLDWAIMALIGTLGPAIGFLIIQNSIQLTQPGARGTRRKKKTKDPALSWAGVAIVSVMLVFFSFGYFGVQPTVIYSGSMQPAIGVGDVVIISEVQIDTIKEGDIIQYRSGNITIPTIHRVYEIHGEGDTKLFITKGDANNAPDMNPIIPDQISGKAIFTLPKIGWIPIIIKDTIGKLTSSI
jgi:signal peptidase